MVPASRSCLSGAWRGFALCLLLWLPVLAAERGLLVGGWRDRSVSDPDVRDAVGVAVNHFNRVSNNLFYSRSQEVIKAQSQVVSGMKYYLKILLVNTRCDKRTRQGLTHLDLGRCELPPRTEQQRQTCKFYVWSRPWLNDTHVTEMSCGQTRS